MVEFVLPVLAVAALLEVTSPMVVKFSKASLMAEFGVSASASSS